MLRDAEPIQASAATSPQAQPSSSSSSTASTAQSPIILDVRNGYEWDAGHFLGAERPLEDEFNETPRGEEGEESLPEYLRGADPDTPVMVRLSHPRS